MSNFVSSSNNWKIKLVFFTLGIGLFILLSNPSKLLRACGLLYSFEGYSFLDPEIVDVRAGSAPFVLNLDEISSYYVGQEPITRRDNLREWQTRYCNRPKITDIDEVVYNYRIRDLDQLRTAILSKSIPLSPGLRQNTFANYLYRNKCTETVEYLIFAKECEPLVGPLDPWSGEERDVSTMELLIEQGLAAFRELESHFIKLRYAFQIIRLAHYAKNFQQVLDLYDYLMPKIDNDPSIIEDWILCHRAGAIMALGDNVTASYLFMKIFAECPSRRQQAFRSFNIKTDEEWLACLRLCNSDKERANLYALRANARHSYILEELGYVYELDPHNENLELLLFRELKKLEKDLLGVQFNDHRAENKAKLGIPRDIAGELVLDWKAFVQRILQEGKVHRLDLWKVAEGYLQYLSGDYYYAGIVFREAQDMVTNDTLKEQLSKFELALKISEYNTVNDSIEREIANLRRTTLFRKDRDFRDFLGDRLAKLYQEKGYPGKSFIMHHDLKELKPNLQLEIINDLLRVSRSPLPNPLEKEMIEKPNDTTTIENDLLDMKAVYYLSNFQIEAAMETMREMNRSDWINYGLYYPFVERIRDCVNCPLPDTVPTYSKGELLQRLVELEYQAKAEPERASALYYQLGLAYYNMSYFSYAWKVMDYFRSGSSLPRVSRPGTKNDVIPHPKYPFGNRENFDCTQALAFFERARFIAKDPELAARAAFMAAKCERNAHYAYGVENTNHYFDMLLNLYYDTKFFQRIVNECKYFEAYATK